MRWKGDWPSKVGPEVCSKMALIQGPGPLLLPDRRVPLPRFLKNAFHTKTVSFYFSNSHVYF